MINNNACMPLIFLRVRSCVRRPEEVATSARAEQLSAILRWTKQNELHFVTGGTLARTRARYRPDRDRGLRQLIESARAQGHSLVMDDVFRFVDGCEVTDALEIVQALASLEAPIFSIRHGAPLLELGPGIVIQEVHARATAFRARSNSAKRAAARPDHLQPAPSKRARIAAARVRGLLADQRARHLVDEIERIRNALPAEKRNSRSAIAHALNEAEIASPSGRGKWQGTTVKRVLDRVGRSLDT